MVGFALGRRKIGKTRVFWGFWRDSGHFASLLCDISGGNATLLASFVTLQVCLVVFQTEKRPASLPGQLAGLQNGFASLPDATQVCFATNQMCWATFPAEK
jgi:hypothetical protein